MAFTRKFLTDNGVPEDKVDIIMAERNRTLTDYVPKADVQAQIDAALKAHKPDPIDPTTTDAYKQLAQERDMLRAINGPDFQRVKPKFREQVFGMIKHDEGAPSIHDQLAELEKGYDEYFSPVQQEAEQRMQFGAKLDRIPPARELTEIEQVKAAFESGMWDGVRTTRKE